MFKFYFLSKKEKLNKLIKISFAIFLFLFNVAFPKGFAEGTLVKTVSGYVSIEKLKEGDEVIGYDTKSCISQKIVKIKDNLSSEVVKIFIDDEEIEVDGDQKFYLPVKNNWISAFEIEPGTIFAGSCTNYVMVDEVKKERIEKRFYDLSVENNKNFCISHKDILVHNFAFAALIPVMNAIGGLLTGIGAEEIFTLGLAAVATKTIKKIKDSSLNNFLNKNKDTLLNSQSANYKILQQDLQNFARVDGSSQPPPLPSQSSIKFHDPNPSDPKIPVSLNKSEKEKEDEIYLYNAVKAGILKPEEAIYMYCDRQVPIVLIERFIKGLEKNPIALGTNVALALGMAYFAPEALVPWINRVMIGYTGYEIVSDKNLQEAYKIASNKIEFLAGEAFEQFGNIASNMFVSGSVIAGSNKFFSSKFFIDNFLSRKVTFDESKLESKVRFWEYTRNFKSKYLPEINAKIEKAKPYIEKFPSDYPNKSKELAQKKKMDFIKDCKTDSESCFSNENIKELSKVSVNPKNVELAKEIRSLAEKSGIEFFKFCIKK